MRGVDSVGPLLGNRNVGRRGAFILTIVIPGRRQNVDFFARKP